MSIDTTNLVAQIQNRIDNLSGTETLKDLLILSKASEGLAVDRTDLDDAIETAIDLFDGSTDEKELLIGSKSLPVVAGGDGYGFTPGVVTTYDSGNGGLYGSVISGLDITSKTEVISLSGKFLIFHIHGSGLGSDGQLHVSINIDGNQICNDFPTTTFTGQNLWSTGITASGGRPMPPILVKESFSLSLQKNSGTAATLNLLIVPIE